MSTIPLSCGHHSFRLLPLEQAVRLIEMLDLEGIDVIASGGYGHVRPEVVRDDVDAQSARLRSQLDAAGLQPADLFLIPWRDFETLAPNHPDGEVRAAWRSLFEGMVDFAARIGSPGITTLPGVEWPVESPGESLRRAAEELSWGAERAASAGLRCSIEPHVGSVCATPEATLELITLSSGVEVTLDYSHFVAQGIAQERVHPLLDHARHVHARGTRRDRLQCGLEHSTIDYGEIVQLLREGGYGGYVMIEYLWAEWQRMNECDTLSETIVLRDRLRSYLG